MHPIEDDLVRRLVAGQFPHWAGLAVRRWPSGGTVNAMYRLGEDMAVRLPLVQGGAGDVLMEREWLPRLAPHLPVRIPEVLGAGEPALGYRWPWSVYRWLAGEHPEPGALSEPVLLARDLAAFVTAMRSITLPGAPKAHRGGPLASLDADTRAAINDLRAFPQEDVDCDAAASVWEEALRAPAWDGPPVWLHADLMPGNLLTDGGRLASVIDFGCMGAGDPACDLFAAWNLLPGDAREVFRQVLAVDDATWNRGRGRALSQALIALPYYRSTNPAMAHNARHVIRTVLSEGRGLSPLPTRSIAVLTTAPAKDAEMADSADISAFYDRCVNESLVLLIGDLAWPATVLLIAMIVLFSQRGPVGRLIDRMRTVSFPGGQAQLVVPEERAGLISEVLGSLSDRLGLPSVTPLVADGQIQNREPVLALSTQPMMQVKTLAELRAGAANILTELAFPPPSAGIGTVSATIDVLRGRGVLDTEQAASLNRMIEVADEAASGAVVLPRVQAAVQNSGTAILDQLDLLRTVAGRKCEEYILDTLRQRAPQGWIVDFDRAIPRENPDMPPARVDALVTAGERIAVVEVRARLRPFAVGQIETARDWLAALPADLPVLIVMLGERLPERERERIIGDHQAPVGFLLWDVEPDRLIARLDELMTGASIIRALES